MIGLNLVFGRGGIFSNALNNDLLIYISIARVSFHLHDKYVIEFCYNLYAFW